MSSSASGQVFEPLKGQTMVILEHELKLVKEFIVDFESFAENGYDMRAYFNKQGWMSFFDVLDMDPVIQRLLKIYGLEQKIVKATKEGQEMEIRWSIMGIEIIVTQSTISKLRGVDNIVFFEIDLNFIYVKFENEINKTLYKVIEEK